jgi:hypothetical protein
MIIMAKKVQSVGNAGRSVRHRTSEDLVPTTKKEFMSGSVKGLGSIAKSGFSKTKNTGAVTGAVTGGVGDKMKRTATPLKKAQATKGYKMKPVTKASGNRAKAGRKLTY